MTSWQDISALKCSERDSLIPPAWRLPSHYLSTKMTNVMDVARRCGILTPAELAITELSAPALVNRMLSRNLSSVAVVTAFCKRAAVAQQLTNCLTEIMFTQAIATAEAIDAEYAKTGRARGALHGLPISLKDNIDVPGFDSSTGFIANVGDKAFSDAELVRVLRAEGAVFHCKTNVPTGMVRPRLVTFVADADVLVCRSWARRTTMCGGSPPTRTTRSMRVAARVAAKACSSRSAVPLWVSGATLRARFGSPAPRVASMASNPVRTASP